MASKKPISAEQFKNKATRIIEIPGFDENETISVLIKPATLMNMLIKGKLPNELLAVVQEAFSLGADENKMAAQLLGDTSTIQAINNLTEMVCREVMIEPKYDDIAEFMSDAQKQSVFNQATGNVADFKPIVQE